MMTRLTLYVDTEFKQLNCYCEISRHHWITTQTLVRGTFLMRTSEQNPGGFALSIKDWDPERNFHVKHYKVKPLDNNRGYYITTRQTFNTLEDLVAGYSTAECKGLCCQLTRDGFISRVCLI